jgi:hypothetical protein
MRESLAEFPQMRRRGPDPETRELVIPGFTYILTCEIKADSVHMLYLYHDAWDWR